MVRPRGWHLPEAHVLWGGEPVSASLFDFGLHYFHNATTLLERGSGRMTRLVDEVEREHRVRPPLDAVRVAA